MILGIPKDYRMPQYAFLPNGVLREVLPDPHYIVNEKQLLAIYRHYC